MNKKISVEPNYNMTDCVEGAVLTNAAGTRQIRIIRNFIRKTTATTMPRVFLFSVLDSNGQVDYNDQKTWNQLTSQFPVKVA